MDHDASIRARLEEHWKASDRGETDIEHAIYAADAILDYPQSGERFRGRPKIQAQRGGHPAETQYFADPFQAAAWRAPLAEPIPAGER